MKITSEEIDDISLEEGKKIFLYLKNKYSPNAIKDLDIIMNALSVAFICLRNNYVEKENHRTIEDIFLSSIREN
jgi:hypothetical protein